MSVREYRVVATASNGSKAIATVRAYDLEDALASARNMFRDRARYDAEPFAPAAERGAGAACTPRKTLADFFGKWPGDESEAELTEAIRALESAPPPRNMPLATLRREPWESPRTTPAIDVVALNDIARAAREASLALDTLTQRLKHALESAPPPVAAAAQLSTPKPPADAPVPESAAESQADGGGADADLPPGWIKMSGHHRDNACLHPATGSQVRTQRSPGWFWVSGIDPCNGDECADGTAPTMLQAMAAALGIHVHDYGPPARQGCWAAKLGGSMGELLVAWNTEHGKTADDCARAALAAFHARQQPAPECKCWRLGDVRSVNRWCALHGQEWQTLVEQQGAPELSARERGRE